MPRGPCHAGTFWPLLFQAAMYCMLRRGVHRLKQASEENVLHACLLVQSCKPLISMKLCAQQLTPAGHFNSHGLTCWSVLMLSISTALSCLLPASCCLKEDTWACLVVSICSIALCGSSNTCQPDSSGQHADKGIPHLQHMLCCWKLQPAASKALPQPADCLHGIL